jgi:hypothetical protein
MHIHVSQHGIARQVQKRALFSPFYNLILAASQFLRWVKPAFKPAIKDFTSEVQVNALTLEIRAHLSVHGRRES